MAVGRGVSLRYAPSWLAQGFALSEDLPLIDIEHLPRSKGQAAGAVDDARPDRWGERVIEFIDKPPRLSLMEYLYYAGDDRFGALGVFTSSAQYTPHTPHTTASLPRLANAQTLSEVVTKICAIALTSGNGSAAFVLESRTGHLLQASTGLPYKAAFSCPPRDRDSGCAHTS